MNSTMQLVAGALFALIVGAYGFAAKIAGDADATQAASESRVVERLNRIEDKVDRLIERK